MSTEHRSAVVRRDEAELKLWGDPVAGEVNDWIYAFGDRLCQMVFSMPPGARFTQSDVWRPIYGADELYYVLSGMLVLANPRTGEVVRAGAGSAVRFERDTWHHGFSAGDSELQVLEFFAPADPSETVLQTADGYGARLTLEASRYVRDDLLGGWRPGVAPAAGRRTIEVVERSDWLWRLEGRDRPLLVGLVVSTPALTAGWAELLPGSSSDVRRHGGDLVVYVLEGRLNILLPEEEPARRWAQAGAADAFTAPAGTAHRYFNMTDEPVRFLLGVAPRYLADGDA